MFEEIQKLFQIDWRIFMAGAEAWLGGRNPYATLSAEFSAGAFAYPPTALTWLALFVPLGALGFYIWTGLELLLWWLLIRKECRAQLLLLCWSPLILHLVEGQSSLMVVLVLWAATRAERRGWLWGLALAWALTKPQVAIVPLLWLLWQDRASALRWRLLGGLVLGTALLALPPTLISPGIWGPVARLAGQLPRAKSCKWRPGKDPARSCWRWRPTCGTGARRADGNGGWPPACSPRPASTPWSR